jgi:alcohol dehydrogenase (cytochrome c)
MVPADEHDWDLTQVSPLYQQTVGGRRRNLVATAGKDGMLRVVDRDTRERVFQSAVTTIRNAKAPVTRRGTHACPGSYGGVLWNGPALHPGANVLAVPAVDWCHTFFVADTVRYVPDKAHLGGRSLGDSAWRGWVTGVDASTGTIRWRHYSPGPVVGAVTATAGGLFFIGELSGDLKALDAVTGAERFRYNTGAPIGAGIVTYEVGGRQYVAVGAGGPSDTWSEGRRSINRIVVLALPER